MLDRKRMLFSAIRSVHTLCLCMQLQCFLEKGNAYAEKELPVLSTAGIFFIFKSTHLSYIIEAWVRLYLDLDFF